MVINNESIVWTKIICVIVVFRCLPYIADTKPAKPAIKSSTLPRTASQGKHKNTHLFTHVTKKKKDGNNITWYFIRCIIVVIRFTVYT